MSRELIFKQLKDKRSKIDIIDKQIADLSVRKTALQTKYKKGLTEFLTDCIGLTNAGLYMPESWECNSKDNPDKFCIYDLNSEMAEDACIFCGQPEERK